MTTTVKKGAGRPAAAQKSNRHAQRTPLPPKKGSPGAEAIEEAKAEAFNKAVAEYGKAMGLPPEAIEAMKEAAAVAGSKTVEEALAAWEDLGDGSGATEKPMGQRTVQQLRRSARFKGIPGAHSMNKGQLLNAHLEWERAQAKTTDRLAGRDLAAEVFATAEKSVPAKAPTPARKPRKGSMKAGSGAVRCVECRAEARADGTGRPISLQHAEGCSEAAPAPVDDIVCTGEPNVSEAQAKSIAKADAFLTAAAALGWVEQTRSAPDQSPYGVIVGRGDERITISWRDGVFVGEECYHSHPARTPRKVINASAAKKIMAVPAAQADEEARKVTAHKSARPGRVRGAGATTERRKALPFDVETATDDEILAAVRGRRISWTNEISGAIQDAYVTGEPTIQPGKSGRSIRFTSMTGFTSVRVTSLVSIR